MQRYTVYVFRFRGSPSVIRTGLTLEEAQEMCRDPQTSSRTADDPTKYGESPWFFGYGEDQ